MKRGDLSFQDGDIEYEANITSSWTDSMDTVQLKHGTSDTVGTPIDRAGLLKPVSGLSWWDEMKRENQNSRIEKLLCSTIASNVSGSIREMSVTLNSSETWSWLTISDETNHTGSIFLTTGFELNPTRRSCKYNLVEIKKDQLTVEDRPPRRRI